MGSLEESRVHIPNYFMSVLPSLQQCIIDDNNTLKPLSSFLLKIHNRYEGKDISKHKRNLAIAGGVTLSVIVSPVVAAVTVGKQILLFCVLVAPCNQNSISNHK